MIAASYWQLIEWVGANGARERTPDDELRDTRQVAATVIPVAGDGFRKCSTHPAGFPFRAGGRRWRADHRGGLERFRAKWTPVRMKKTRQHERPEPGSDSIRTDTARL